MKDNWISIEDRLPELDQAVLLFDYWKDSNDVCHKDIRVGYLTEYTTRNTSKGISRNCEWGGCEFLFNITHWQPLPEPPKEK